jgi:hypothetical protein
MGAEEAAPCRHAGAPPQAVVDSVTRLIRTLGDDAVILRQHGLTAGEYKVALPAAIEALRGRMSASNSDRREFLENLFKAMLAKRIISKLQIPTYGDDTVYRLTTISYRHIAIIQKGCPDGAHSSVRWNVPDWASETYLWWLCDSMRSEPGEHIAKGVNRLRQRFFDNRIPDFLDGIIFHNQLCGTAQRLCPKASVSMSVDDVDIPAPCIYVMPDRQSEADEWNWDGSQKRIFPAVLLAAFGIDPKQIPSYTGYVGFQRRGGTLRTTITSRFGPGRVTTFRS